MVQPTRSTALMVCLSLSGPLLADIFVRGDANVDGKVDISDAVSILGCLFVGAVCPDCADARDSNDSGKVDLSDAITVLGFRFLGDAAPPAPYPQAGPDPSPDLLGCAAGLGPELLRLEASPPSLSLEPGEESQLAITGVYSDGARVDRTASSHGTLYEAGNEAVAGVGPEGLVRALAPGETAVFARLSGVEVEVPCAVEAPGGLPPIVISEVMYHPVTDDVRDEYVEIHNRGRRRIDLAGYRFTEGIEFTFPALGLDPGQYLAVARDAAFIQAKHGIQNVVGNYQLQLDDGGERIRLRDPAGNTVDEVRYDDGGLWPRWADGWGSSLELIDLRSENDPPAAWAASDESLRSAWTPFQCTQTAAGGSAELHLLLLHQGECLIDNLQVMVGTQNRLANGSFENDMQGWLAQGTHRLSGSTTESAVAGETSLHLVATGRGDTAANRIECDLTSPVSQGQTVTIRGSARWLRGSRHLLTRLHGNATACANVLQLPGRNGTPGAPNSTAVPNRGPDIDLVSHFPVLPTAAQRVRISALVRDLDGVAGVELSYRVQNGAVAKAPMVDDGSTATSGDLSAGDGFYTASLAPRAAGSMVSFWIAAQDRAAPAASASFPAEAPSRTCLYRTGEPNPASQYDRYHVWMPQATLDLLRNGAKMSNELLDITFVLNDTDVFYNARIRYRGSPFIRAAPPTDPVGGRYAYRIDFGEHQPMREKTEINLDNLEIGRDPTLQRERTAFILYRELGLPASDQEYVRLWINGSDHQVYEDVGKVDQDYVDVKWPEDRGGFLHKIDDYFEFDDGGGFSHRNASLQNFGNRKEEYRWNWEKRSHDRDDDWNHMVQLAAKMNAGDPVYESSVDSAIDAQQWARVLAIRKIIGDWDSYGYNRGKNMYAYLPAIEARWKLIPWDMDFLLGNGDGAFTALFGGIDPAVNRFLAQPRYRRMYLRAFDELVQGPFRNEHLDPILDAEYAALRRETSVSPPTSIKDYVRARRSFVLGQLPGPELVITTNGGADFSTSAGSVTIAGQAPLEVESFRLNGAALVPTRSGLSGWSFTRSIPLGETLFLVEGLDGTGAVASADSIRVLRVPPCVPASVAPNRVPAAAGVTITISGSGFVPGSAARARLTSASDQRGFSALYVEAGGSYGGGAEAMDSAVTLLNSPQGALRSQRATHLTVHLRSNGGGEVFPSPSRFPAPWNGDPSNLAARFSGFIQVPGPGRRTFGVNSDDGFRLTIGGSRVAEWPQPRGPAVSMGDFNFPAAGSYPLVLEWYENGGGDIVELFQEAEGGQRALLNGGSELTVTLDDVTTVQAASTVVETPNTIRATFDLSGAEPGGWSLVITPQQGSDCELRAAVTVE